MRCRIILFAAFAFSLAFCLTACTSAETSVVGPTTDAKCQVSASSSPSTFSAGGGPGTVSISTSRDCTWTIATNTSWVSLNGDRSGQGGASVTYTVAANPVPSARSGSIVVAAQTVEVTQAAAPCRFGLDHTRDTIGYGGGNVSLSVTTLSGCNWTATSRAAWITVTAGKSGTSSGTVALAIAANNGDQRIGDVDVSGQVYTVVQDGVPPPPLVAPTPAPPSPSPSPGPNPTPTPPGTGERVRVDGRVTGLSGRCPVLSFSVSGVSIVTTPTTDFRKRNCDQVQNTRGVDVTGIRLSSGLVIATAVEIGKGNDATSPE